MRRAAFSGLASCIIACGSAPTPAPVALTVVSTALPAPAPTTSASVAEVHESGPPVVPMYPVASIYSLLDVTRTDGGIEVRVGIDDGGGTVGHFRYAPIVNGAPDFEQETVEIMHADTTGFGYVAISGKRPRLFLHSVAGFRSAAGESYAELDDDLGWSGAPGASSVKGGIGAGVFAWTKDRLLEWRGPQPELALSQPGPSLPAFRVVQGDDKAVPSIPAPLHKRLESEGFVTSTMTVMRSGEVVVVGRHREGGIGTVLWGAKLAEPGYFVTNPEGFDDESELTVLGGTSFANLRLQAGTNVMRLVGSSWVVESKVAKGGLPDVFFGSTLVIENDAGIFSRTARDAPWIAVQQTDLKASRHSVAVDLEGTIWKTEDDMLLSSKKPPKELDVTEEQLVAMRKRSVLRGGSDDATGAPPESFPHTTCRMHYVLLDQSPIASAPSAFPKIEAALKGHGELAKAKFVISREKGWQLFGALLADQAAAEKTAAMVSKKVKGSGARVLCAEPVVAKELHLDVATGVLSP